MSGYLNFERTGHKELLEQAAKAAGLHGKLFWSCIHETFFWIERYDSGTEYDADSEWNPLKNDGDAFRLANKLNLGLLYDADYIFTYFATDLTVSENYSDHSDTDSCARMVIGRAAMEIGRGI